MADYRFNGSTYIAGLLSVIRGLVCSGYATFTQYVKPGTYATAARPTLTAGDEGAMIYDTTLNQPLFWDGSAWQSAALAGLTITAAELNLFDPTGRTTGTVPTSDGANSVVWSGPYLKTTASGLTANKYIGTDGSGNIVIKTDPLTSFTEADTLASVTGRGAATNTAMTLNSNLNLASNPAASATDALLNIGPSNLSGGSGNGTFIGINKASFTGDYVNFQNSSVSLFRIGNLGDVSSRGNYLYYDSGGTLGGTISTSSSILSIGSITSLLLSAGSSTDTIDLFGIPNFTTTGGTASTVGAAGGASALPATPSGYIKIKIAGTAFKIPYYAD